MSWLAFVLAPVAAIALLMLATLFVAKALEEREPPTGAFVEIDGARVHYLDIASENADPQRAFLLLHGANLDGRDMRMAFAESLPACGRVIIPDRPGQGHTPCPDKAMLAPDAQARLMRRLLAELGIERVTLVGHSLGGFIALRFAAIFPDAVEGLVLINPASHPRPGELLWYQKLAAWLFGPLAIFTLVTPLSPLLNPVFVRRLFSPEAAPDRYAMRSGLALGMMPGRFLASMREYAGLRDELVRAAPLYGEIACPALIVSGADDAITPAALHADRLVATLPNARGMSIGRGGHMVHHAHAADIVAAIASIGPSARSASAA